MVEGAAVAEACWCTRLPVLPAEAVDALDDTAGEKHCYCPDCLKVLMEQAVN
jgi:hypothetical protein